MFGLVETSSAGDLRNGPTAMRWCKMIGGTDPNMENLRSSFLGSGSYPSLIHQLHKGNSEVHTRSGKTVDTIVVILC